MVGRHLARKTLRSDEHIVATNQGCKNCRSIWRRPEQKRWDKLVLEGAVGSPWEPVPATLRAPKARQVYITVDRVLRLGRTPDCPGCLDLTKEHTQVCRQRFSELISQEKDGNAASSAAQPPPPAETGATGSPAAPPPEASPLPGDPPLQAASLCYVANA